MQTDYSSKFNFVKNLYPVSQNSQSAWEYKKNTDDFGRITKAYLCAKRDPSNSELKSDYVFQNLKDIGAFEGFEVIPTKSYYFARDAKVRLTNGKVLRTTDTDDRYKKEAITRSAKKELFLQNNNSMCATEHPAFQAKRIGTGIVESKNHRRAADGFSLTSRNSFYDENAGETLAHSSYFAEIKPMRSAFEGGDIITATNSNGKVKVLIGEELLTITQNILRQTKLFGSKGEKGTAYVEETVSTFKKLGDRINGMYLEGKIPAMVEKLAPAQTNEGMIQTGKEMNAMGLITKFEPKASEKLRAITSEYLGQQRFVKEVLWPEEFEVDSGAIETIVQAAYHLDVVIKPGPYGSMFLQSYEKDIQLLQAIKDTLYDLTSRDRKIIESCIEEAQKLAVELKPIYDKIKQQLAAAGFPIIETPGMFHGIDGHKRFNCNFINAISGWSTKTEGFYYICLGTTIGDDLGKILMESFRAFMEQYASPIRVYFVGHDPNQVHKYDEADYFNQKLAGVHCMTFELETESIQLQS